MTLNKVRARSIQFYYCDKIYRFNLIMVHKLHIEEVTPSVTRLRSISSQVRDLINNFIAA